MLKIISTSAAPAAIGPYSQAIRMGNFLFTSGQLPMDPGSGQIVEGPVEAQTEQALKNVKAVLEAAGSNLSSVIKTTVFIKNMEDFARINSVYSQFFAENPPARSCVEVARLPKDALVEIEVIACVS